MSQVLVAVKQVIDELELRGSKEKRKAVGSFFTDYDVAYWLSSRAITRWLLTKLGIKWKLDNPFLQLESIIKNSNKECIRELITAIKIVDPTCGAGVFLVASWDVLNRIEVLLDSYDSSIGTQRISASQLYGFDIDSQVIQTTKMILSSVIGEGVIIKCCDALGFNEYKSFDVIIGNPPYLKYKNSLSPKGLISSSAGNTAAWIVEHILAGCSDKTQISMVLPISAAASKQWGSFRSVWAKRCSSIYTTHFDTLPSSLFSDAVQRISVFEGSVCDSSSKCVWYTSSYHRWLKDERSKLFENLRVAELKDEYNPLDPLPKLGCETELDIWNKLNNYQCAGRFFLENKSVINDYDNQIKYKRRWSYFLLFTDFTPPIWDSEKQLRKPSELQVINISKDIDALALIAIYSSSLFWWWFSVVTDNRNVNRGDLAMFPIPNLTVDNINALTHLGKKLMEKLQSISEIRECNYKSIGKIYNTYYRQRLAKDILDEIDNYLSTIYVLHKYELNFILNFERRFRS